VKTHPISGVEILRIIEPQHVPALDDAKENRERTPLFFHRGKQAGRWREGGAG
jgi:hypothetical protein